MSDRYSFVCDKGCGVCGVKVVPFRTMLRSDFDGRTIAEEFVPDVVSTCCGSPVSVYDNVDDQWLGGVIYQDRA